MQHIRRNVKIGMVVFIFSIGVISKIINEYGRKKVFLAGIDALFTKFAFKKIDWQRHHFTFELMTYLHFKALHIIFVVSWFAGLFYMPRLFVYHTEASLKPDPEREILTAQFTKMEKLLWNAIMTPACWLALIFGTVMLYITPAWLDQDWMRLKLLFVIGLLVYHFYTRKILLELRQGKFRFSSFQLRLFNEVATIFLFSIVFLVVLKNTVDWLWGVLGLIAFAIIIMSAVRIVKRLRERKA